MKFALALLALVAVSFANVEALPCAGNGALTNEIQDFLNLVPVDQIISITIKYMSEDKEFQDMITFFQGDEFKKLVTDVEGLADIKALMKYVQCDAGFDIYGTVNAFNDWLGLPRLTPPEKSMFRNYATGGIRGYLDEIEAILPLDKLKALFDKKMKESKVWADFINQLKSDSFQQIVNKVYANATVQKLIQRAKEVGIDLKLVVRLLKEMLGIDIPSRR